MKKIAIISLICLGYLQAQYNVLGSASNINNNSINCGLNQQECFNLTQDLDGFAPSSTGNYVNNAEQTGAVWNLNKINLKKDFDLNFCLEFSQESWDGADGMSFTFQNQGPNAIGLNSKDTTIAGVYKKASGLGYAGISPSLNVEFDIFGNDYPDAVIDENNDHVTIHKNGNLFNPFGSPYFPNNGIGSLTELTNLASNTYTLRVIWSSTLKKLNIYLNNNLTHSLTLDLINNFFNGDSLVYYGFTGATGSFHSLQQVCFQAPEQFDLGPNITLCEGETATLYATYSAAGSYQWNSNPILNKDSLVVSTEGWYYCDIYNDVFNVTLRDSVYITVNDKPAFDLDTLADGTPVAPEHCIGDVVGLSSTNEGYTYLWSNGSAALNINATSTGWYWLNANNQGCTFRDSIYLTFHEVPNFDLDPTASYCEGESVDVTLSNLSPNNSNILWSNNATSNSINVSTAGTYTVTATNAVCSTSKSITVSEKTKPAFDLDTLADGTPVTLDHCIGDVIPLSSTNEGYTYLWNNGSAALNINASNTGWYWLNADNQGCTFRDSIYLTFHEVPDFDLTTDTIICQGISTLISINNLSPANADLVWNDANNTIGASIYINAPGTYTITATNNVCITSKSINVTEVLPPNLDLSFLANGTPTDSMNCVGDQAELSYLDEGYNYTWSTGANSSSINTNQSGYYWLEAATFGCVVRDSIYMLFAEYPTMNAINDTMFCEGGAVQINISGLQPNTTGILWNDGDTDQSKSINNSGNYQITLNNQGCYAQENFLVEEIVIPQLNFNGPADFCFIADTSFILTVPYYNDLSYLWYDDNSTDTSLLISQAGQYTLEINKNICTAIFNYNVIEFCALDVEIPNIVTPNNDGINDYFKVNNTDFIQTMEIQIQNRWGATVFTSDNKDVLFYPTSLVDGVYFVIIDYVDYLGNQFRYTGDLTITR